MCFEHPVFVDGAFKGLLIAFISMRSLSEFISELDSEFGHNAFVLYGRDAVLAHPMMAYGYPDLTALNPLPPQATFGDPVLASMWEKTESRLWGADAFLGRGRAPRVAGRPVLCPSCTGSWKATPTGRC